MASQSTCATAPKAACATDRHDTRACHPPIGKLLPDDLYVHTGAIDALGPLLRVYEGCGRMYLGEIEGANLIKIHRRSGRISYLGGGSNRFAPPSPRSPARWFTTSAENGMSEFDARVNS
jgi:hypothetical protein